MRFFQVLIAVIKMWRNQANMHLSIWLPDRYYGSRQCRKM